MEKHDKKCAIIRAAMELVGEFGFHGAPMALVAERAGVAAGTIYCYFQSKDELINEVYQDLETRMFDAVMKGYPEGDDVQKRFIHIGTVFVQYFIQAPLEFRFLEQFRNSPYGVVHRREKFFGKNDKHMITKLFNEARGAGIMKDLPLPLLFSLTFGPLFDACRDHILHFIELDDALLLSCVEACWDAVRR